MTNLFIVYNATQYMSALEARYYYAQNKNDINVLLLITTHKKTLSQIENVINKSDWSIIISIYSKLLILINNLYLPGKMKYLIDVFHMLIIKYRFANSISNFNNINIIAVGNYYISIFRHFINTGNCKLKVLLDDGVGTFTLAKLISRNIEIKETLTRRDKWIYKHIFKYNNNCDYNNMKIFSCFPLEKYFGEKTTNYVDINSFTVTKKRVNNNIKQIDEVWFLGSPMVEAGELEIDKYKLIIHNINVNYCNNTMKYIPHKNESIKNIKIISSVAKIKYLNKPVELYLLDEDNIPKQIISFYSSGLFYVKFIYDNIVDVKSIYCDPNILNIDNNEKERLYETISNLKECGIKLVTVSF